MSFGNERISGHLLARADRPASMVCHPIVLLLAPPIVIHHTLGRAVDPLLQSIAIRLRSNSRDGLSHLRGRRHSDACVPGLMLGQPD